MIKSTFACLVLLACGSDSHGKMSDAPLTGSDGSAAIAFTCSGYCSANLATCTGANVQWGTMQNCLDTCSHWAMGAMGDTSGDTLGCRIYHTAAAESAPTVHCMHAGPTGGTMCGTSTCATFCPLENAICPGVYPPASASGACDAACPTIATNPPFSATDTANNDIECRFYHLTAAATDPTTHCPHTAKASSVCTN